MSRSRSAAGAIHRLLQAAAAPIYVLDDSRQIVFANAALLELVGAEEAQLIGERCDYHSTAQGDAAQNVIASLCPPPDVWFAPRATFVVSIAGEHGKPIHRRAECLPLADDGHEHVGLLVKLSATELGDERDSTAESAAQAEAHALHQRLAAFRRQAGARYRFDRLLGESPLMRQVRAQAELAVRGQTNVLIVGPMGSGREHLARAIHAASAGESPGTLIPLACPLLDAESLQTMVRHLKRRLARDSAHHDVLLLLDADQMPVDAQDELAGFLNLPDFKLPTLATARKSLSAAEVFRPDLARALETLVIDLPPLSERRPDIPLLAQMLLEEHNRSPGAQLAGFTPEALDELAAYPWPGNIDELAAFVAEACERAAGPWVLVTDLPARIGLAAAAVATPKQSDPPIVLDEFLTEIEKELIERTLARCKGNRTKAATLLGITRARLHRRLVQLGLAEAGAATEDGGIAFEEVDFVPHDGQE